MLYIVVIYNRFIITTSVITYFIATKLKVPCNLQPKKK